MQQQGIMPGQKGSKEFLKVSAKWKQQQQNDKAFYKKLITPLNKDGTGSLGNLENTKPNGTTGRTS
jgi:hypothetical protein